MNDAASKNQNLGIIFVLIAAMAWSTAGLFTRVVSTDIPTTLFWRSLSGGVCVLMLFMFLSRESKKNFMRINVGEWIIAALSTAGMVCFISAFFFTTIANVSFVYGTMPLVTFLLALIFLRQRADWISFGACVLCAVGVGVIVWGAPKFNDLFGIALALAMTFFMAALTIAAKYFPAANMIKATYLSAFLGALVTAPFATFFGTLPADYFWLILYGFANVGLGFGVYLIGVKRVTAVSAALLGLLEIPIAPVWAWLLFDERAGVNAIAGGGLILIAAGGYIVMKHRGMKSENKLR